MGTLEQKRKEISERLKEARTQSGLSQAQVAKMLGLHRPSISEAEAGRRNVAAHELSELARIYGVRVSWLACAESTGLEASDARLAMVARELERMKPSDFGKLIALLEMVHRVEEPK